MSKSFKEMTTEELREYMNKHTEDESGELAFTLNIVLVLIGIMYLQIFHRQKKLLIT